MAKRHKMLFIVHVDWGWIKQRPQFMAEALSAHFEVVVLHRVKLFKRGELRKNDTNLSLLPLLPIPWSWPVVGAAFRTCQRLYVGLVMWRTKPDLIWVTHPAWVDAIPLSARGVPIVYDCMDDALGFAMGEQRRKLIQDLERDLVHRASKVICSSEKLKDLIGRRYGKEVLQRVAVVRNAISSALLDDLAMREASESPTQITQKPFRVAYVGTIAEWMDFDVMLETLNACPDLEFHLIGPIALRSVPQHVRMFYHGTIDHKELGRHAKTYSAFIMPFVVTPLIEAVDPVKLYEYISYPQETISVFYDEIARLRPYIHFYSSAEELRDIVVGMIEGRVKPVSGREAKADFVRANTWDERANEVLSEIELL